jgi:hypothetical protein
MFAALGVWANMRWIARICLTKYASLSTLILLPPGALAVNCAADGAGLNIVGDPAGVLRLKSRGESSRIRNAVP